MTVPTTAATTAPDGSAVVSGMPETATLRTPSTGAPPRKTFWSQLAQAFAMFRNPKSIAGLIILGVFVLIAILAPWIAPYGPTQKDRTALRQPPSWEHWLGTTHMGEDVLSQIIYGTRGVIVVGFLAAFIATIIAITIGVIAGYVRGWKSESLSALTNVFLVIPGIPLIIIIASQFENPPLIVIAAVLGITGWAWGARVLRAQTMSLRNRDFIQAARANGEPLRRIITVEMLPNLMALIASSFVGTVTAAILGLTTLAFIGVIPVSNLNWGTILFWAQQNGAFPRLWWWYVPAGLCIAIIGVALSLINFGIDEYVNPRLRSAGERARAMKKKGLNVNDAVTAVRSVPLPKKAPDPVTSATSPDPSGPGDAATSPTPNTNQNTK
ncbi:Putative peptide transport permease protein [Microbacterium oxydans]|uniref:Peptide transport permease protein n=1 Tax=Microbacterium oxydans TaxID=82380 RepID=A0A3Q9J4K2_9MICO|nr:MULTISPECIES: ABC transporter permease [Microbacterium]AZS39181.1 Putative peptide transport permease protein [Microbacterium oxydans]